MRPSPARALVAFAGLFAASCREPAPPSSAAATGGAPAQGVSAQGATVNGASDAGATDGGAAAATSAAASGPFTPERVHFEGKAMGTHVQMIAYTTPAVTAPATRRALEDALAEIRRLESKMTTWRPDTELSRVNAAAGTPEKVVVSDETFEVVDAAQKASAFSDGAFDITFETLHGLWKFDEDLDPSPPTDAAIKKRLPHVGYKLLETDAAAKTLRLKDRETRISLGGIAKGYAVDKAAAVLARAGLASYLVQAGGDLYGRGTKPDGSPWQAGVRDPRGPATKYFALIGLDGQAFSTAGDYERSYVVGGKRYHHILDPRTGKPATACRSVTIWAPTALQADAIDDAVFILGPERGMAIVEAAEGVGAVVVDAKNQVWISKRLRDRVQIVAAPSEGI